MATLYTDTGRLSTEINRFLAQNDYIAKNQWISDGKSWIDWIQFLKTPCIYKYKNTCIFDKGDYNSIGTKSKGVLTL
jgi:hypothetical protein